MTPKPSADGLLREAMELIGEYRMSIGILKPSNMELLSRITAHLSTAGDGGWINANTLNPRPAPENTAAVLPNTTHLVFVRYTGGKGAINFDVMMKPIVLPPLPPADDKGE